MRTTRAIVAWVCVAVAAGCSTPPPLFPPPEPPILWPAAGDPPRFAYKGKLEGEVDLKRPASFWTWLGWIFGGEPPRARLTSPYSLAVSAGGVLYVADPEARLVHAFDLVDRAYSPLADAGGPANKKRGETQPKRPVT